MITLRHAGKALILYAVTGFYWPSWASDGNGPRNVEDWPAIRSILDRNPADEARIRAMVAGMSLAQKVGQMTQPEIKSITPAEVSRYYIGSVLNGGGSWPNGDKHAGIRAWLALADRYHEASMAVDMPVKIPLIWGTDAVHGHNNVYGATLFPHNIGLGAAHDPDLVREVAAATAKAVRATGIGWVFAPTLAVARDDRWGRSYESFSEDAGLIEGYAAAYVSGLQGRFASDANVVATAKHFIGDGGTDRGRDQGVNLSSRHDMINRHALGYYGALAAGVQTVMASFNSWRDDQAGIDYGKMHGSQALLTGVLKERMGFDGFVVSDWNGIAQLPGCSNASCAQAINAGIDMVMVPDDWKAFIANTIAQVQDGTIPLARIDDAVTRILRVKLRAGLFDKKPSQGAHAGDGEALLARALARRAVRESLVLLKNDAGVLPLARGKRILVVGKSADSLRNQTGGWSLTWQGNDNRNSDFPSGDTVLAAIREMSGPGQVTFSETAQDIDPGRFDAIVAVIGEMPYAETNGDLAPPAGLGHGARHPEDPAVLRAVAGKGVPVVTVFLSGRPLYVNDLLNLSDAFVAAWLPGTEGKGITDVLFRTDAGQIHHDFRGTLSFSWPKSPCQSPLNQGDPDYAPLFPLGYGQRYGDSVRIGRLATPPDGDCGAATALPLFRQSARPPYRLYAATAAGLWRDTPVGDDLNAVVDLPAGRPALRIRTVDVNTQQDARQATWLGGAARVQLRSDRIADLRPYARNAGVLQFDVLTSLPPEGPVRLGMDCEAECRGGLDIAPVLQGGAGRKTVKVPLACFAGRGVDLGRVSVPFSLAAEAPLAVAFANVQVRSGEASDTDALRCAGMTPWP